MPAIPIIPKREFFSARRFSIGSPGRKRGCLIALVFLSLAFRPAIHAQQELSLSEALRMAIAQSPAIQSRQAAERSAHWRTHQARAGRLPSINYSESVQVGNNPVYVFGSLLEQHRFGPANFAIASLNRPDAMSNYSSALSAEQVLYDGNRAQLQTRLAETGQRITRAQSQQTEMDVLQNVLESYFQAVLAHEQEKLAGQTLQSTEAELQRAEAIRAAGMSTDADVLALRAEEAAMNDRLLLAQNAVALSLARLNDAMGAPLESAYRLITPLHLAQLPGQTLEELEELAAQSNPELRQAGLAREIAAGRVSLAQSAFQPQVSVFGSFEANRKALFSGGGTNWMTGVRLDWNLFRGMADRARQHEETAARAQREQEWRAATSAVRLQVRQAYLSLQSAASRIQVAEAAITAAQESHRIVRDRYSAGLATVTDLLRSQTALHDARLRRLAAVYEQRVAAIRLERAVGAVNPTSAGVTP